MTTPDLKEARRLADVLDLYATGDEYQRPAEKAVAMLRAQADELERLRAQVEPLTPTVEDINAQQWAGMDGATAFLLIDRHAEGWAHCGRLMEAWRTANAAPAQQAEPYGHAYTVNGVHQCFDRGAEPPPDDAYDAGSLVPVYTGAPSLEVSGVTTRSEATQAARPLDRNVMRGDRVWWVVPLRQPGGGKDGGVTDTKHQVTVYIITSADLAKLRAGQRNAFEAEIRRDCGDLTTFGTGQHVHYRNSAVNNSWCGFQSGVKWLCARLAESGAEVMQGQAAVRAQPQQAEQDDEMDRQLEEAWSENEALKEEIQQLRATLSASAGTTEPKALEAGV